MQTTASFSTRQPSKTWMPVASGSRAVSNQFANGAQAADFNWILTRQNWFGSARARCSRNSKASRRVSVSEAWRSSRSNQCETLVSRWTASWICGPISARLFRPATIISAGFDNFDTALTKTIDKDSYRLLCCRGSTIVMSHSLDYLRLHWLLSSESSTPLLASSPTSDLATMSAMFYAIYIGSQSVSEYHTRCASWCLTSSMEQRQHTWLAWSRASPIFPGRCHLCSAAEGLFDVPRTRTVFGSRAFSIAGPVAWNGLPAHVRAIRDVIPFKSALKNSFFSISLRYFPLTILSFCVLFVLKYTN